MQPLTVLEKYIKPGGRQVSWLKFVQGTTLHRYLRLTPLYCVVLLIYICEATRCLSARFRTC